MVPSCGEEHDACDIIRLYKDTMPEYAMDFSDPLSSARASTLQELKIAERVPAYNGGDMDRIARIDEREEERRK